MRINPATNQIVTVVPVAYNPIDAVVNERGIWLTHWHDANKGVLTLVDLRTNSVAAASEFSHGLWGLVIEGNSAWVTNHKLDPVLRLSLMP